MSEYLTTRELAALLRIKERKVYELAASGQVPCSKAMGKLLFPRAEVEAWIASGRTGPQAARGSLPLPNVFLGSHDPLLEWALRESCSGLATYFDSSVDGLRRFHAGEGVATGLHLYDAETNAWNTPAGLGPCARMAVVLMEWAKRERGLIVAPEVSKQVRGIESITGLRLAARQDDAGAQLLFNELLRQASIAADTISVSLRARSETDGALAVLEGKADVSFGLRSLASQYRLAFVPLIEERFDLLVDRRAWFEPALQSFFSFCRSEAFTTRARAFAGYDVSGFGTIHFNGPRTAG